LKGPDFDLWSNGCVDLSAKQPKTIKFVENGLGDWAHVNQVAEEQVLLPKRKR